mmetsp:Transcript_99083/g.285892  ORF Transcript_99083/g.285892 Transcript_99083/m.285892 type:complete len:494 (-) Transcript_99083:568-2049(-)
MTSLSPEFLSKLRSLPGNHRCGECRTAENPSWCSISFGIVLCLECSAKHRGLGTHISFVRSLEMDEIPLEHERLLLAGGNDQCYEILGDVSSDTRQKYDNALAEAYKKWLQAKAGGSADESKLRTELEDQTSVAKAQSSTIGKSSSNRKRMDLRNQTPAPSFLRAFFSAFRLTTLSHLRQTRMLLSLMTFSNCTALLFGWANKLDHQMTLQAIFLCNASTFLLLWIWLAHSIRTHRLPAFKSAVNDFLDRVHAGLAKRNPDYDIFFPPNVSIGDSVDTAFIFYPGMLVDYMVYSKILGHLSDTGCLVLLIHTEPCRLPLETEGFTASHAERIMMEIQTLLGIQVGAWALGGHSMGAIRAAQLAMELGPDIISKCLLWGCGHWHHISGIQEQSDISLLTIDASEDHVVAGLHPAEIIDILKEEATRQPNRHVMIEGGNHSGFAHYSCGPHFFLSKDGERTITLDEQQERILKASAAFFEPIIGPKIARFIATAI